MDPGSQNDASYPIQRTITVSRTQFLRPAKEDPNRIWDVYVVDDEPPGSAVLPDLRISKFLPNYTSADQLGAYIRFVWGLLQPNVIIIDGKRLYPNDQRADYVFNNTRTVLDGMTNQQALAKYGVSMGDQIAAAAPPTTLKIYGGTLGNYIAPRQSFTLRFTNNPIKGSIVNVVDSEAHTVISSFTLGFTPVQRWNVYSGFTDGSGQSRGRLLWRD